MPQVASYIVRQLELSVWWASYPGLQRGPYADSGIQSTWRSARAPACVHVVFRLCAREHGCVVAKPCFGVTYQKVC